MNPNTAFKLKKAPKRRTITENVKIMCDCGYTTMVARSLWISDAVISCPSCRFTEYWEVYGGTFTYEKDID